MEDTEGKHLMGRKGKMGTVNGKIKFRSGK